MPPKCLEKQTNQIEMFAPRTRSSAHDPQFPGNPAIKPSPPHQQGHQFAVKKMQPKPQQNQPNLGANIT
jgi:hypothetical protein